VKAGGAEGNPHHHRPGGLIRSKPRVRQGRGEVMFQSHKASRPSPSRKGESASRYQACGMSWSVRSGLMRRMSRIVHDGEL
jgi:hypothetical protein